jgi:hypothetical protein
LNKKCELCGKIIPKERVEALPDTKRCVECSRQKGSDFFAKRTEVGMDIDTYKDLLGATRS